MPCMFGGRSGLPWGILFFHTEEKQIKHEAGKGRGGHQRSWRVAGWAHAHVFVVGGGFAVQLLPGPARCRLGGVTTNHFGVFLSFVDVAIAGFEFEVGSSTWCCCMMMCAMLRI